MIDESGEKFIFFVISQVVKFFKINFGVFGIKFNVKIEEVRNFVVIDGKIY